MGSKPRLFSSALSTTERRVYGAATVVFVGAFFGTMWPVYTLFNRIRPFVLGVPFSLFYLVFLALACFLTLFGLFRWEDRRDQVE
jgi:hypothetical protein